MCKYERARARRGTRADVGAKLKSSRRNSISFETRTSDSGKKIENKTGTFF